MKSPQIPILLSLALLTGCAAVPRQETRFYLLEPLAEPAAARPEQAWIGLGPVTLARYLDRPQMVTRSGPGQVHLEEFHQWAGPLQENVSQVLSDDLARRLGSERLAILPARGLPPLGYQIEVDILRLDAGPSDTAFLEARWRLIDGRTQQVLRVARSRLQQPLAGGPSDYAGLSRALSQLLAGLAEEIAAAL